jgi:WD40 repeat protein
MADIFISYSRKDGEFVRRLQDALSRQKSDVWVDWKDIPPTAEWLQEIYAAIESSHTVVFVLSPDSVTSEICEIELTHAVGYNKRLVPVVRREVDPGAVKEELARLNWIFFRDRDDFNSALNTLIEAVDTDLGWVHTHTRLLTRAIEWKSRQRNAGYLLRGGDLREAEAWLSQNNGKEPRATPLQIEYIRTSRGSAVRRKRLSIGALLTFLIVALGLGWWGLESQRRHASALSGRLAEQALAHLNDRYDLALLLAMEAYDAKDSIDARRSLLAALQHSPYLITSLHGHKSAVQTVAFKSDGVLMSVDKDGVVMTWDPLNYRRLASFAAAGREGISSAALSSTGSILALGGEDGGIELWDMTRPEFLGRFSGAHTRRVKSLSFSPDGRTLASGSEDYSVILWDVGTRKQTFRPYELSSGVAAVTFSPAGRQLTAGGYDGIVYIYEFNRPAQTLGQSPMRLHHNYSVWCAVFSSDGTVLATGDLEGNIILWDTAAGKPLGDPLAGHDAEVLSLAFSPDGDMLASGASDGSVVLWDLEKDDADSASLTGYKHRARRSLLGFKCNLSSRCSVTSLSFSPDRSMLASAIGNTVVLWSLAPQERLGAVLTQNVYSDGIAFSENGRSLAVLDDEGKVYVGNSVSQAMLADPFNYKSRLLSAALSPDGNTLAAGSAEGSIGLWDITSRRLQPLEIVRPTRPADDSVFEVLSLVFSPDGSLLAALSKKPGYDDKVLRMWDVKDIKMLWDLDASDLKGWPLSLSFSRDGKTLALLSGETVNFRDASSGKSLRGPIKSPIRRVSRMAISPDHHLSALAAEDDRIILWDLQTGGIVSELLNPGYEANSGIAFSADNLTLASTGCSRRVIYPINGSMVCDQDEIRLWDIQTARPLGRFIDDRPLFHDFIQTLVFSPAGNFLASVRESGTAVLWNLDLPTWQRIACRLANRNLTDEEQISYLENKGYHGKCYVEK